MSGDEARKMFFNEKGLDFVQGYKLLMGGVSQVLEPQGLVLN
jgi:sterol 14-demethylase